MAGTISGVTGSNTQGGTVTIAGSGFGTKSVAKPQFWADFETNLNPTNDGVITSWVANGEGMALYSRVTDNVPHANSAGAARSPAGYAWPSQGLMDAAECHVTRASPGWNPLGGQIYLFRRMRRNFRLADYSNPNCKHFRSMSGGGGGSLNFYHGEHNGKFSVEGGDGTYEEDYNWYAEDVSAIRDPDYNWHFHEWFIKINSGLTTHDARADYYRDNAYVTHAPNDSDAEMNLRSSADVSHDIQDMGVALAIVNGDTWGPAFQSDRRLWIDDIYLDNSWLRVMAGNAATYNACTILTPCLPTAWSANGTSITVKLNKGGIASPYLYVMGSASIRDASNGMQISGGGSPPTGTPVLSVR